MEAEDIIQDAFIKVFKYLGQFKFEGSFEGWIRRIVVNTAIRHLEKKKLKFSEIDESANMGPTVAASAYTDLGADDILNLLNNFLLAIDWSLTYT
jgi:RNA polymerase sigma-70 factor (ECF subfamily)